MPRESGFRRSNFNTSHVSINHNASTAKSQLQDDFNTSHVSINRNKGLESEMRELHFNTSHVSINQGKETLQRHVLIISIHLMFLLIPLPQCVYRLRQKISIHLMFLLIRITGAMLIWFTNFNTSHVSINQI